eukprot:9409-Heterococcus_DN1.PRE.5
MRLLSSAVAAAAAAAATVNHYGVSFRPGRRVLAMHMVTTRGQKQALSAASNPLRDAGILKQIFSLLPGTYLFLGAVCREWRAVYAGIKLGHVRSWTLDDDDMSVACNSVSTLCSAAVASPATAKLANDCGLRVCEYSVHVTAGLRASFQTLLALHELGMPPSHMLLNAVALSGRIDGVKYLVKEKQCPLGGLLNHYAARSGSISMLKWLRAESKCVFNDHTCSGAAQGGHLAVLKHLRREGCDWEAGHIACEAAATGNREMIDWLWLQLDVRMDAGVIAAAADAGHTAMCQHLRSLGCHLDPEAYSAAAAHGHLETLRWLRENGCFWGVSAVCLSAVRSDCTDILDYIVEQGEVLSAELLRDALNSAGVYGHLQAAQWLRAHGAQWPAVLGEDDDDSWRGSH